MKNYLKNKKLISLLILVLILVTSGFKCGAPPAGLTPGKPKAITLEYWKVFEASSDVTSLISAYQKLHPEVTINYRNFTFEEYENELINALAEDRGPDIFSIHTTWQRKYQSKIQPLPAQITLPYAVEQGTIQKQIYTQYRTQNAINIRDLRSLFPDVVYDNQAIDGQIYSLPLSIDTLALFYNRDLLNNAGIANPPQNWDQFKNQVIQLTKQDVKGNIIQSGAAIGTANNVARATDILSLLMMQNGTPMTDDQGFATFNRVPQGYTRQVRPANEALNFYTDFASPAKQVYTWNDKMPNSLQAFMSGKTAFYFGYSYDIATIKAQAPKLNFEVISVPQIGNSINFANYWVETVSKKSQHLDQAWDFVQFITTNLDNNKKFLDQSKKPTALRSLIDGQLNDIELAPFASQVLTAKSWYKGKNPQAAEEIMKSIIRDNQAGVLTTDQILELGVSKINQTYQ